MAPSGSSCVCYWDPSWSVGCPSLAVVRPWDGDPSPQGQGGHVASADAAPGISHETRALFASHPGTCFFRNVILPHQWVPHLAAREGLLGCFRWGGTVMCVALVTHDSTPQKSQSGLLSGGCSSSPAGHRSDSAARSCWGAAGNRPTYTWPPSIWPEYCEP